MQNEPIEVTLKVTDALEEMGLEHIQPFIVALQNDFYIDEEMIAAAIQRNSSFNIIHRETMFKVDVFIPSPRPFQKSQIARAKRQTFDLEPEISANFASAEDTILSKLEWYRMEGEVSDRQWRDILSVLKTREGELEIAYLRKWANELKVIDLLERALVETK